jgi:hypothetical protein
MGFALIAGARRLTQESRAPGFPGARAIMQGSAPVGQTSKYNAISYGCGRLRTW